MVDGGESEEHRDGYPNGDIEEGLGDRDPGTGRAFGEGRDHLDHEVAGQHQDEYSLDGMQSGEPEVPSAEVSQSLGRDPCRDLRVGGRIRRC